MIKPILFGYGLTTKAIAKLLGGGCMFYDDMVLQEQTDENGNHILPSTLFVKNSHTLQVTTPSFKPNNPLILNNPNVISEYDYLCSNSKNCYYQDIKLPYNIWISGTNGKTTTTQMITHLLSKKGAISGGNIGTPLADMDIHAPIWVLETSSFTLHHTKYAKPDLYILLPITPDHLDWHGDSTSYTNDKLRALQHMKEGELAILPKGLNLPQTNAFVFEYESSLDIAKYFGIDSTKIRFKAAFLQDALLALAVTKTLFDEINYDLINAFELDRHRQEEKYDVHNRLWVNDSKATNLDATIQAVLAYDDRFIHLILGGDDKGVALDELFEVLTSKNIHIYAIGSNTEKLLNLATKYQLNSTKCNTLDVAIETIASKLKIDEVALLSPAAASLDQFSSYKQRGDLFLDLVGKIQK